MARRPHPGKPVKSRPNPLDAAKITYIDYKDTDLLRKFVSDRGKIRSRRVTRVTAQQQRALATAVKNAREMRCCRTPAADGTRAYHPHTAGRPLAGLAARVLERRETGNATPSPLMIRCGGQGRRRRCGAGIVRRLRGGFARL